MNLDRLDLNLLRIFAAVHVHGSVTAAAVALHLSQPTISNALARLRRQLGDELFVRQGMGLQPTAFAMRLAPKVHSALTSLADAVSEEQPFNPLLAQRLFRMAMTDAGHQVFLPKLAQELRTCAPGVQLQSLPIVFDSSLAQALGEGQLDLVIGPLPEEPQATLEVISLFNERYVAVLPRRMLDSKMKIKSNNDTLRKISLAQLRSWPLLVVEQQATHHRRIPQALAALGLENQIRYRLPFFSAVAPMILAVDALAIIPSQIAALLMQVHARGDAIAVCELPFHLDTYTISLARHPRFARDSGINWLTDLAQRVLSV